MMHQHTARSLLACVLIAAASAINSQAQLASDMIDSPLKLDIASQQTVGKSTTTLLRSPDISRADIEFTGVVLQGFSYSEGLTAQFRVVRQDGTATAWIPMYLVRSASDDGSFLAGYPGAVVRSGSVEVLLATTDGRAPDIIAAGVFDKRLDDVDTRSERTARKSGVGRDSPDAVANVIPPDLITRADWNAGPFIGNPVPLSSSNYTNMTFHHAAGFTATTYAEGIAQVKAIQDFHQNGRGWSDIGYQFVVDRGGRVYQGRPFLDGSTTLNEIPALSLGAHVGGFNTGNIGICLLGCYHPPEGANCVDQVTVESLDTYITMFAFLGEAYNIPISDNSLKGHRDFSSTSCPGDNAYALLPTIRQQAIQAQQFGNEVPDVSTLEQNAPNPFSTTTTIRYYLYEEGVADLRVYDVNGREVAVLVDDFREANRWYQTTFDATGLASGMYYYRLRIEGFSGEVLNQSKPMVHVR